MTKAWANVFTELNERTSKPRPTGITMVIDKCHGPYAVADHLDLFGDYADHWKLSFGTTVLLEEGLLRQKIAMTREQDVLVYPGGTLTEVAIVRGVWREYLHHACELGFNGIEVSDGTIHLAPADRRQVIRYALDLGLTVVTEVGKKDREQQPPPEALARQALADFADGASWVIVEARESGRGVGVFDEDGSVHEEDVNIMADILGDHLERLVWEAPLKRQQEYFILRFGPNVCLGNIQPRDVLGVEALRVGLRFETFRQVAEELQAGMEIDN
ncbi:MAG: phosphosulfolactate synthase [Chloroflexi bacterium]|nr:phosphosulfolactate synthase [Chloroflexota bacterium]MCI0581265.1 phosphosulfolactate synthase [Chloroflexota bacterium]MCI0648332.1 phosphosulfolactate synthase [Chloroflexota bacterium]MCI0730134.1 phosphosulfolactate synthase [Chloroflexota bacterium]